MNREILEKQFDKEQIKQRKGTYGNMLDYVDTGDFCTSPEIIHFRIT